MTDPTPPAPVTAVLARRAPTHRAPRPARARPVRPAILAAAAVVTIVFLGTFVFPTRSFLSQRAEIADAKEQLAVLDQQNQALADQATKLQSDAEIERLAREQYNLVKPGEEAYALLPTNGSADPPVTAPTVPARKADLRNPVRKVWDGFTGLF
jgi:cell division protein FtsB